MIVITGWYFHRQVGQFCDHFFENLLIGSVLLHPVQQS